MGQSSSVLYCSKVKHKNMLIYICLKESKTAYSFKVWRSSQSHSSPKEATF